MSSFDRRTWQRPKGERTTDPHWIDDVRAATGRRGRQRVPNPRRHGDSPIRGDLSYQYKAIRPRYHDAGGEEE